MAIFYTCNFGTVMKKLSSGLILFLQWLLPDINDCEFVISFSFQAELTELWRQDIPEYRCNTEEANISILRQTCILLPQCRVHHWLIPVVGIVFFYGINGVSELNT